MKNSKYNYMKNKIFSDKGKLRLNFDSNSEESAVRKKRVMDNFNQKLLTIATRKICY